MNVKARLHGSPRLINAVESMKLNSVFERYCLHSSTRVNEAVNFKMAANELVRKGVVVMCDCLMKESQHILEKRNKRKNQWWVKQWIVRRNTLTYLLTPWCRVLLEKLTGLQLVKKFPTFYGTQRFITALTSVCHLSLSWARPIQSIYPHPASWRSILILSTHLRLGLPNGLFPSGFPTKILYTPLSSPICATCPAHLILLDFITRTILDETQCYRIINILMNMTMTTVAQWLRRCATNRKVTGSIPGGVIGIFHWHKILPIALWPWGRLSL